MFCIAQKSAAVARIRLIFGAMILVGGCTSPTTPLSPTTAIPSTVPPAPRSGPSAAVLVATVFTVHPNSPNAPAQRGPRFTYQATLRLKEVGGVSGATVTSLILFYAGTLGGDHACFSQVTRIAPSGTWDMNSLSYCEPGPPSSNTELESVSFEVSYVDDLGRAGKLVGETTVVQRQ